MAVLVWDVTPEIRTGLPRNFRSTDDKLSDGGDKLPNLSGLRDLHESGGAEFTTAGLQAMLLHFHGPVTIFDLRQESHVFVNDEPISWFATNNWVNVNRSHDAIEADEARRLESFKPGEKITLNSDKVKKGGDVTPPESLTVTRAATEREIVEAAGAHYVRVTVTDHARPLDDQIDRFVAATREVPSDGWAHFHCRAGRGRTTTFMVLYDMLHNAKQVSLEDIAKRQELLAKDYDVLGAGDAGTSMEQVTADRVAFVRAFYQYAQANPGGRPMLWTEWLKSQS